MRILTDENIPLLAVHALRTAGHDVHSIRESARGISDIEIAEIGLREDRLILTFDKDFGEIVFRHHGNIPAGVILLRIAVPGPAELAEKIVRIVNSRTDWAGHFSVVDDTRVRMTLMG
jgi:predicted nuclease of predicted toxin-antitoxin system